MRFLIVIPVLLLLAYLYPYLPGHDLPWCAIKIGTGFDCPGCGIVRSVSSLLHGELVRSLHYHPMGAIVVVWMLYKWTERLIDEAKRYHRKKDRGKA